MRLWLRVALLLVVLLLGMAAAALLVTTTAGAHVLVKLLEVQSSPADPARLKREVQAIALVGGRTDRVHHAARLHLATGLPILIVGRGTGDLHFAAESQRMEDILRKDYGIRAQWVETESLDTRENAIFAWCLLERTEIRRLAVVTDPHHMPRALANFAAVGFDVVAAPTEPSPWLRLPPANFVPGEGGLRAARMPLQEWGGMLLARLEGLVRPPPQCHRRHPRAGVIPAQASSPRRRGPKAST